MQTTDNKSDKPDKTVETNAPGRPSALDMIEKSTTLRAPLARVWGAISDSKAFGTWFGMTIDGPFVEGQTVIGAIAKTQVDDEIAKHQEPYVGIRCELRVVRVVPPTHFAFRWHPDAESGTGPDAPTTLVTFQLEECPEGTRLTITESGFDSIPLERRAKLFSDNEGGWEAQLSLIGKYLAQAG
jgi:uncharacterized protein YndB with AHSA1/START domain